MMDANWEVSMFYLPMCAIVFNHSSTYKYISYICSSSIFFFFFVYFFLYFFLSFLSNCLLVRKTKERFEGFNGGDSIRIELFMPQRHAIFFKNERQLPFRLIAIPPQCRFYVCFVYLLFILCLFCLYVIYYILCCCYLLYLIFFFFVIGNILVCGSGGRYSCRSNELGYYAITYWSSKQNSIKRYWLFKMLVKNHLTFSYHNLFCFSIFLNNKYYLYKFIFTALNNDKLI
jgi:hypothetical protein